MSDYNTAEVEGTDLKPLTERAFTEGVLQIIASDGVLITTGNESTDFKEEPKSDERPRDCCCWDSELKLPCWPCYREGFRSQNPSEPASEEEI